MKNSHFRSQINVSILINQIIEAAFYQSENLKAQQLYNHKLQNSFLNYIYDVAQMVGSQPEPRSRYRYDNTQILTEPNETKIQLKNKILGKQKNVYFRNYKLSSFSQKSSKTIEGRDATKSKLKAIDLIDFESKLLPLPRKGQAPTRQSMECEEKISKLRQKKMKLEEAMKVFKDEDKKMRQVPFDSRKLRDFQQVNFTTDFKGKLINFSQRMNKLKEESKLVVPTFKISTNSESIMQQTINGRYNSRYFEMIEPNKISPKMMQTNNFLGTANQLRLRPKLRHQKDQQGLTSRFDYYNSSKKSKVTEENLSLTHRRTSLRSNKQNNLFLSILSTGAK